MKPHRYNEAIIEAIQASGMSLAQLGSMANINRSNIRRYVRTGQHGLGLQPMLRLMEVLGLFGQRKPLAPGGPPVPGVQASPSHDTTAPPEAPAKALVPMKAPERPAITSGMKKGKIDPRSASKGVAAH